MYANEEDEIAANYNWLTPERPLIGVMSALLNSISNKLLCQLYVTLLIHPLK